MLKPLQNLDLFRNLKIDTDGYGINWTDEIDLSEYECWKNSQEITQVQILIESVL